MVDNRVIIYGGCGGLGTVLVSHFKAKGWWVCSIDIRANEKADQNVLVNLKHNWTQQEESVIAGVKEKLGSNNVEAILNMAGKKS